MWDKDYGRRGRGAYSQRVMGGQIQVREKEKSHEGGMQRGHMRETWHMTRQRGKVYGENQLCMHVPTFPTS